MKNHRLALVGFFAAAMFFTMACGMVTSLFTGGTTGGSVDRLWDDVPALDGATKADLEIPLAARLTIQAVVQGRMDFIAFTTSKTPKEVQEFYSKERMANTGWNTDNALGCSGDLGTEEAGALCFFGKKDGEKQWGLAIIVAQDEATQQTQVFYARIDVTEAEQPAQ